MTFDESTGVLSGTPVAGSGGIYGVTFTASNGVGSSATQSFTLTVHEAPAITSGNGAVFAVGNAGNFAVTRSGFPLPSLNRSGTLPSGVTFTPATGSLSGTPATGTGGTYPLIFTATNGVGNDATQSFNLTVNEAVTFTSADSATFTVGSAGSFSAAANGFPAPAFSTNSALPNGISLSAAGVLSGTPMPGTGGVYSLTITASNGASTRPRPSP